MIKNRWCSVDAHFHDGAGRVLLSVLPIKAAKHSIVTNYNLSEVWLPWTHGNKSLTLCWRSVDIHFHDGAERVLLSVLPIKVAKNSFVTDYNLAEVWFPRMHDQKSLTLRWRSFCHGCIHNMQSLILAQSIIHFVLAAFLAFSFTFFLITTLFFNNT